MRRNHTTSENCSLWDGDIIFFKTKLKWDNENILKFVERHTVILCAFWERSCLSNASSFWREIYFRCWNVYEQWGIGTGSWGTLDSLFLGHLGKCLSTVTAAGTAQPEAEQLWLPPSQAFSCLLGYHCVSMNEQTYVQAWCASKTEINSVKPSLKVWGSLLRCITEYESI